MISIINSGYPSLAQKKTLSDLIEPFISKKEKEKFLIDKIINIRSDITPQNNKRVHLVGSIAKDILEDLTYSHPEIIEEALKIRDANGQLLFPYASNLIEFIALPYYQWRQIITDSGLSVEVDINKTKPSLLDDLLALKGLTSGISPEHLLNHVIALRGLEVPFKSLLNLDCNRHPQEVAFYYNNPRVFTQEKTAVIFSCTPESDHNSSFAITPRTNKFYETLSKVFNISYRVIKDVQSMNQHLNKLNEDGADIALIIVQGHGAKNSIVMSDSMEFNRNNLSECLTSLPIPKHVVVLLIACSTGLGLAQNIANQAKLAVWAPDADASGVEVKFQKDNLVFYSKSPYYKYIEFTPQI
jgi:hypothetical protein